MAQGNDSVRIVLFDRQAADNFVVLTETDDPDNWKLPGGRFDTEDETPIAAARRELHEELGLEIKSLQQIAELKNDDGLSRRYIFSASVDRGDIRPSTEVAQTRWVTIDAIPAGKNQQHIYSAVRSCSL